MARDNSPKERQLKQLERKQTRRASYDRILIVSEGSKTEPNYFRELRAAYRLHTANVEVRPSEYGTTPVQVVQYAQNLFQSGNRYLKIQPGAFEKVYAVFDRDDHENYHEALALASSLDGKLVSDAEQPVSFHAIVSIPNFELWLLLHFEDVLAPIHRDAVMHRLKLHLPSYNKASCNAFAVTVSNLPVAIQRADRLAERFSMYTAPEPFTGIVDVVKLLTMLRR